MQSLCFASYCIILWGTTKEKKQLILAQSAQASGLCTEVVSGLKVRE